VRFVHVEDAGKVRIDRDGWEFGGRVERCYEIHPDDPTSARVELCSHQELGREGELDVRIDAYQLMTCDETHFQIHARLDASEEGVPVYSRTWLERIRRDGV
jgi:hypothetical protein